MIHLIQTLCHDWGASGEAKMASSDRDGAPALDLVVTRLPGVREEAHWLFACDETFRDLCEEYKTAFECVAGLDPDRVLLRNEFAALLLRLEGALLSYS
jgi:hypothetical protein